MIVDFTYIPVLEDFYNNGDLSLTALLKIFENAGSTHSDLAKDNILEGSSKGKAWVLLDWKIQVIKMPKYGTKLLAKTWLDEVKSPFGTTRNFLLYTENSEEICVKGVTKWVMLDLSTNRPTKIAGDLIDRYAPEKNDLLKDFKIEKIQETSQWIDKIDIELRRGDIDFNNHVHNLCYLDFACEVLPKEIYDSLYRIQNLRITYKNAITFGEKICAKYAYENNRHLVGIYSKVKENTDTCAEKLCTLVELW